MWKPILKVAKSIVQSEEKKKSVKKEIDLAIFKSKEIKEAQRRKNTLALVLSYLESYKESLEKKECHIKEGERVVVNKYEMGLSSSNPWDSGSRALYKNSSVIHSGPIYATIKNISVSYSKFYENFDIWYDTLPSLISKKIIDSGKTPINCGTLYKEWCTKVRGNQIFCLGLYLDATFELEGIDFKPGWGLNIYSFLNAHSERGKVTIDLWEEEVILEKLEKDALEKKEQFRKKKIKNLNCYG